MLIRLLRHASLPMLALLLAAAPLAHADDDSSFCHDGSGMPAARPHLKPSANDTNSGTLFTGSREVTAALSARKIQFALCRGDLHITRSADNTAHLEIRLRHALPANRTIADYIDRFDATDGSLHLAIDLPEANGVSVTLALPEAHESTLAIGTGKALLDTVPGNLQIAIGKGDVSLHAGPNDIGEIEIAAAVGGLHDTRPNGFGDHGHMLTSWTGKGPGRYKLEFAAGAGDLILLPRPA